MRIEQRLRFITHDGTSLCYRHWPAQEPNKPSQAVLLFHQGLEHGKRMAHLVDELDLPHCDFFAWDARGHGESVGKRGDTPSFTQSVLDVQYFVSHICSQHGIQIENMAVLAQGIGALITAVWVHDYAPRIRALTLAAPVFSIKFYFPFAYRWLKLLYRLRGNLMLKNFFKAHWLTHDRHRITSFKQDPSIGRALSLRWLLEMHDTAKRVVANAHAICAPTQLLIASTDRLAKRRPQEAFFARLGTTHKEKHLLAGFFHDILGERDRAHALHRVQRFFLHQFERPFERRHTLLSADRLGFYCAEAESFASPLPNISFKAQYWRSLQATLRIAAKLSDGIRLGFDSGFDSAATLDYIYRNQASGKGALGRWIDRQYLNSISCQGIRQRKQYIEELLKLAVEHLHRADTLVRIVDIAAGHGRYILETLEALPQPADSVLLRDGSELNVKQGRMLIASKAFDETVTFVKADAFDRTDLALLNPKPTVVVISGLYELVADNQKIRESMAGIAAALEKGSWLLYTNQPWNPQLELMARTLPRQQDGKPWVMRRRSQAEMDQIVYSVGFRKVTQRTDPRGIFTVSLAQRVS